MVWEDCKMSLINIDAVKAVQNKAISVRAERSSLLTTSDWTQVADAPVDQAV